MKLQVIAQTDIQVEEYLRSVCGIKKPIKCEMVNAVRRNRNHVWNIGIRPDLGECWNVFSVEFDDTMVMVLPREYCIPSTERSKVPSLPVQSWEMDNHCNTS